MNTNAIGGVKKALMFVLPVSVAIVFVSYVANTSIHAASDWFGILMLIAIGLVLFFVIRAIGRLLPVKVGGTVPVWGVIIAGGVLLIGAACAVVLFFSEATPQAFAVTALHVGRIYVFYLFFAAALYCIGEPIRNSIADSQAESPRDIMWSFVFGIVGTICFFYAAALLGRASSGSVLVFFGIAGISALQLFPKIVSMLRRRASFSFSFQSFAQRERITVLFLLTTVIVIAGFLNNAFPQPFDGDSLRTYYAVPMRMLETGRIVYFPHDKLNNASLASSYVYLPILSFGAEYLVPINVFLFIILICGIYAVARRYADERAAYYSVLCFLTADLLYFLMVSVKSENVMMVFVLWSGIALGEAYAAEKKRWLLVSGALIGVAVAVKYTAVFGGLFVAAAAAAIFIQARVTPKQLLEKLSLIGLGAVLAYAPWAVRSWLLFGHALYPFSLTGRLLMKTETSSDMWSCFIAEITPLTHTVVYGNNVFKNLWLIISNASTYPNNRIGPVLAVFFVVALIRGYRNSFIRTLGIGSLVALAVWYATSLMQMWYAASIISFIAIVAGYYVSSVETNRVRWFYGGIIGLALFVNLPLARIQNVIAFSHPEAFAGRIAPGDAVENYLNTLVATQNPQYLVLPFGPVRLGFVEGSEQHIIANLVFEEWAGIVSETRTADETVAALHSRGITHVYYHKQYFQALRQSVCAEKRHCKTTTELVERIRETLAHLTKIHETEKWELYAVD